jgi:acetyl-CoA carboxylase biotin carboxyl carrier protein
VPTEPLGAAAGIDERELTELLALVAASDVVELEVAFPGGRLSLRRPRSAPTPAPVDQPASGPLPFLAVTSPLVGIFRPVVGVGAHVEPGQPLGAIEALGLPTSVDAPAAGTVEEVLVADGGAVEFGQTLLLVRVAGSA